MAPRSIVFLPVGMNDNQKKLFSKYMEEINVQHDALTNEQKKEVLSSFNKLFLNLRIRKRIRLVNNKFELYKVEREKLPRAPKDDNVRGRKDADVRGRKDADVRGPKDADVRGPKDDDVRGPKDDGVRGPKDDGVRGPKDDGVRGPRDDYQDPLDDYGPRDDYQDPLDDYGPRDDYQDPLDDYVPPKLARRKTKRPRTDADANKTDNPQTKRPDLTKRDSELQKKFDLEEPATKRDISQRKTTTKRESSLQKLSDIEEPDVIKRVNRQRKRKRPWTDLDANKTDNPQTKWPDLEEPDVMKRVNRQKKKQQPRIDPNAKGDRLLEKTIDIENDENEALNQDKDEEVPFDDLPLQDRLKEDQRSLFKLLKKVLVPVALIQCLFQRVPVSDKVMKSSVVYHELKNYNIHLDDIGATSSLVDEDVTFVNKLLDQKWYGEGFKISLLGNGSLYFDSATRLSQLRAGLQLRKLMDNKMQPTDRKTFTRLFNLRLADIENVCTLKDLVSVACPGQWVANFAVHCFAKAVNRSLLTPVKKFCFGPYLSDALLNTLHIGEGDSALWMSWYKNTSGLDFCDKDFGMFFLPVLVDRHWRLLVLNLEYSRIDYLDSLYSKDVGFEHVQTIVENLKQVAACALDRPEIRNYDLKYHDVPSQPDLNSCGIFMMSFIKRWLGDSLASGDLVNIGNARIILACDIMNEVLLQAEAG